MPDRYWEPGCEEYSEEQQRDDAEAQAQIEAHGIEADPELPFN